MNLHGQIEAAELRYKNILEEFFVSVYNERSLPSHGIDHHRRVWNYAKELISIPTGQNTGLTIPDSSKLIIACYLHDIGMSVESGEAHGKYSKELCRKFLATYALNEHNYDDVLKAIENHDNKKYPENSPVSGILSVLSVADDLDAFGLTGIFRYTEIYLTRGIDLQRLGYLIKENGKKRFENFAFAFGFANELVEKHRKRYEILISFFNKYNQQIPSYRFGTPQRTGYCGVVETLQYLQQNKITIMEFLQASENYSNDAVIQWFFKNLEKEM